MHDRERLGAYLERIGYTGPVEASLETLRGMHRAHFYTVPFENLSIARGERIVVDPVRNFEKVVERRRGGFCLELTGLFAWALRKIGFDVEMFGARVVQPDGDLSVERSHMTLLVHLDGEPWIADVGFGGQVAGPLRLHERAPQVIEGRIYTVATEGDTWAVSCDEPWQVQGASTYRVRREPLDYDGFEAVCDWLQTSPDSRFTGGDIVSLALEQGRLTYAGGRLIETRRGERTETTVESAALPALLEERFGIRPPA